MAVVYDGNIIIMIMGRAIDVSFYMHFPYIFFFFNFYGCNYFISHTPFGEQQLLVGLSRYIL